MTTPFRMLERILTSLAVASVAAIMVLVSADAMLRYIFNAPLSWSFELVSYYLLVVATWFMVASTLRHGDHINITIVRVFLPPHLRFFTDILWSILAAAVFLLVAYGASKNIGKAWSGHNFIPGYIPWPVWLTQLPIFLGALSVVMALVSNIIVIHAGAGDPYANEGDNGE